MATPSQGAIVLAGQPELHRELRPTAHETVLDFQAPFALEAATQAYFKVLPNPGNPVLLNGTEEAGWWTRVHVTGPEGTVAEGATNGTTTIRFDGLQANTTYWLHLHVRVPAGELAQPQETVLRYVLAAKAPGGSGSGAQLDPSVAIKATITVSDDAPETLAAVKGKVPAQALVIAGSVALAAGLVGWLAWRRR